MCKYCEGRSETNFGWNQPSLPYHNHDCFSPYLNIESNIFNANEWEGHIYDFQTSQPQLILTCNGYKNGKGVGTIYIPIKYCPECGRKLGHSIWKGESNGKT